MNSRLTWRLWTGLLAGPLAFAANLQVNYMLVDVACQTGPRIVLHLSPALSALLTLGAGVMAWQAWQDLERPAMPEAAWVPRGKFMAISGVLMSGMFLLVVLAQWIPVFVVNPCQR